MKIERLSFSFTRKEAELIANGLMAVGTSAMTRPRHAARYQRLEEKIRRRLARKSRRP